MPDQFEVEQKFPVPDTTRVAEVLRELGATFHEALRQVDRYYAHPSRDFAQTDEALRIRRVGDANFVTYKGPKIDAETKTRREIEIPLPPGDVGAGQFAALLEALGFSPVGEVRKLRRAASLDWQGFSLEVALDEVEQLGHFIELEIAVSSARLDAAKAAVASLAKRLDLRRSERRSYLELLMMES